MFANPNVISVAFSDEVLDGLNSDVIALDESQAVVLRVDEQHPPELRPLEAVAEEIRDAIVTERATALLEERRQAALARLEAGDSVTEIAKDLGGVWQTFSGAMRVPQGEQDASMPREVRDYAFRLPRPNAGQKSVGSVTLADGAALVTVTRVQQGSIDVTSEAELEQLRTLTGNRGGRVEFQGLLQAAEEAIGVERPQTLTTDDADV